MASCFRETMILSFMITASSSSLLFLLPKCVHPPILSFYFSCHVITALLRYKVTYQHAHPLKCTVQWFVVWLRSYAVITTSNFGAFSSCQSKTPMSISSRSPFPARCIPWSHYTPFCLYDFIYSWQSIMSPHIKFSKPYHSRYQYFLSFWQNNIFLIWIYHSFGFINRWTSECSVPKNSKKR